MLVLFRMHSDPEGAVTKTNKKVYQHETVFKKVVQYFEINCATHGITPPACS